MSLSPPLRPITATYRPHHSFFRRQSSSSSSSSTTTNGGTDDLYSSSSSSSDSDSDASDSTYSDYPHSDHDALDRVSSTMNALARGEGSSNSARLGGGAGSSHRPPRTPPSGAAQPSTGTSQTRAHLKLSLALLRTRQALQAGQFDAVAAALKGLAAALPSSIASLGVFLPILDRLARDLEESLGAADKGKDYRRGLRSEDAKALVALQQRWTKGASGKGRGKESDVEWVPAVRDIVARTPPPDFLLPPHSATISAVLNTLESLLLPSSLPRLSLSSLGLTSNDLARLKPLLVADIVLDWYLSFAPASASDSLSSSKTILRGVRSLDLSKNRLDSFPSALTQLFPSLETLSLSHNTFSHLPPHITLFSSLRRLKTHGSPLSRKRDTNRTRSTTRQVTNLLLSSSATAPSTSPPSLLTSCILLLHEQPSVLDSLPPHLASLITLSYVCCSCSHFLTPLCPLYLPPLFSKLYHLDPGVSLPSPVVPRPPTPPPSSSPGRQMLSLEERVLLALYGRNTALQSVVVGPVRLCQECALSHLGLRRGGAGEVGDGVQGGGRVCMCVGCKEERRVKGEGTEGAAGGEGVMRWLRKRGRTGRRPSGGESATPALLE